MQVLLTGGAGYIGSHIALELISTGYDVVIADNFSNSSPDVIDKIGAISGTIPKLCELDLRDAAGIDKLMRENSFGAVIHLAGYKAVGESVSKPLMYYRNNIDCSLTLLEAMERNGISKLIFSSSATVYGSQEQLPYIEDMEMGITTHPYGATKQMIERIITDCAETGWLAPIILRYFNPVGAHESGLLNEKPSGIPNNLMPYITQVAEGKLKELSVFGDDYQTRDGTGVRDYIHVVDLAKGHVAATDYELAPGETEIFNLGTGTGYSVLEMLSAFERVNGVNIPYRIAPRRSGDIAEFYSDASKAERLLGWKANLGLDEMCRLRQAKNME